MVSKQTRRRVLELTGSAAIVGLAGCTSGDGGSTETTGGSESAEEKPWEHLSGVSKSQFLTGPVPESERTAKSLCGEKRDPDALQSRDGIKWMDISKAVEQGLAEEEQECEHCAEYIPDKNGDGYGACLKVEGYWSPEDWCSLFESVEEECGEGGEGTTATTTSG